MKNLIRMLQIGDPVISESQEAIEDAKRVNQRVDKIVDQYEQTQKAIVDFKKTRLAR